MSYLEIFFLYIADVNLVHHVLTLLQIFLEEIGKKYLLQVKVEKYFESRKTKFQALLDIIILPSYLLLLLYCEICNLITKMRKDK